MSKDYFMRQCKLVKDNLETTSWIPERYAIKDAVLELKESDGSWTNGWVVKDVYNSRELASKINDRSRGYLKHRSVTDV